MKKSVLSFAVIAGVIIIFLSLIFYLMLGSVDTMTPQKITLIEIFGYLRILILIIAIFIAMRSFRKDPGNSAYMSIVKTGLMVALIVSIFIGIGETVYMAANPGFYDKYAEMEIKSLQEKGVPPEGIAEELKIREDMKWMANPAMAGIFCFLGIFIVGAVASFLLGIFLRSKNNAASIRV